MLRFDRAFLRSPLAPTLLAAADRALLRAAQPPLAVWSPLPPPPHSAQVINLGVLLILLFFVTGIVTVQLFGRLCLDDFRLDAGPVSRLPDLTPWFNARSNIRFDPRSNSRSSVWSQRPV